MMRTSTAWSSLLHPGDASDFFARRPFPPFDPNDYGYSPANALWLAELSRLVYRHDSEEDSQPPQPTRTSFLINAGYQQRQFFFSQKTGTQAMLVESQGATHHAVLVFRGTEQVLNDFITNIQIGLASLQPGKIDTHAGFTKALDSVWPDIAAALARLSCPVFYTGHSLGAALATLAAARHTPLAVYTFGSPRVGNQAFVDSLGNVAIHRVVDDEDIVATVPPEALGFRHAGTAHCLIEPASNSDLPLLDRLNKPPKQLADHAPINYVDRIVSEPRT